MNTTAINELLDSPALGQMDELDMVEAAIRLLDQAGVSERQQMQVRMLTSGAAERRVVERWSDEIEEQLEHLNIDDIEERIAESANGSMF